MLHNRNSCFCTGELSRVYNKHDLGKIFAINEIIGLVFTALASLTPVLFTGINFHIGWWHVTTNNFIGLFLAVLASIVWLVAYFFLPNLTLDPIYKEIEDEIYKKDSKETESNLWETKDIVQRADVLFIVLTQAFLNAQHHQMELLINMTASLNFHQNISEVSLASTIGIVGAALIMLAIRYRLLNSSTNILFLFALSFMLAAVLGSYLNVIITSGIRDDIILKATIAFVVLLNTLQAFGAGCYTKIILFSMAPGHSASIIESHRKASASFFICVAFFTASAVFSFQYLVTPVYNLISLMIVVVLLYKRRSYIHSIKL